MTPMTSSLFGGVASFKTQLHYFRSNSNRSSQMKIHSRHPSTEIRRSSTASSDNSPSHHHHVSSLERTKRTIFTKMKTFSSNGEWITPEKRHFYEDLNVIFSEDPKKFLGVFQTDFYKIIRQFVGSEKRPGVSLYYTRMEPNHKVKAQIAIIHGFGEHSGRYLTFGDYFAKKGFLVHLIDLSGFGYSGGAKCSASLEDLHQDIESLLGQCEMEIPLFMMGQGFGAGLMLSFLMRNRIKVAGVITTAALIESHHLKSYNGVIGWLLDSLAKDFGDVCFNAKLNPTSLSKNNYNIKKYLDDPLLTPLITLKMVKTIGDLLNYLMPNAHKFDYPILMIHGSKDIITDPRDSFNFINRIASKDKTFKSFDEGFHQLHDDNELYNLQKNIHEWCKARAYKSQRFYGIKNQVISYGVPNKFTRKIVMFVAFCLVIWLLRKGIKLNSVLRLLRLAMNKMFKNNLLIEILVFVQSIFVMKNK